MRRAVVFLLAGLACACGAGRDEITGDARPVGPVTVTFKADPATVREGQSVRLSFKLVNNSGQAETLTFPSGQKYDFWATLDGREVWRWSEGKAFTQAIVHEEIAGQGGVTYTETWTPEEAGTYEVHGALAAQDFTGDYSGEVIVES